METKFIEAGQTEKGPNWGKFLVGRFTPQEWARRSVVEEELGVSRSLLNTRGWAPGIHYLVLDIETGEGAIFGPLQGSARADLNKHAIWVCPMFETFLAWLYEQDLSDLSKLPSRILLPDAEFEFRGYRRPGPVFADTDLWGLQSALNHAVQDGYMEDNETWARDMLERLRTLRDESRDSQEE